jgi:hypothetical protein
MEIITSKDNRYIKAARALNSAKGRAEQNLLPVEGLRLAEEALSAGVEIGFALITEQLLANPRGAQLVEQLEKNYGNECRFLEEARRHKGNELYQKYYFECPVCHNPVAYVRIGKRRNSYVCNQEKIWISKQE